MVIDSVAGMLTSEAHAGKRNDSSGWINASSGIFCTSAASEKADWNKVEGVTQEQKTDGESKRTRDKVVVGS